jgi:para-nitrobenzyl esterase
MNTVEVETTHGKIRGITNEGVNIFKGIPYAGTVSGTRRFCRPAELEAWSGVRDALQLGAPAIQSPRQNEPPPAEDCLFLNIWTPANDNQKRPVMFYSHGGGFVVGSGGTDGQDGTNLARNFDVVVVQTNHRLGLLGFLYLDELAGSEYEGSGNRGVQDIAIALEWVNKNISLFGGDPDNVLIFGESGGGAKTSCLYAMPEAAPYFHKASIESGPGVRMYTRDMAAQTTARVLEALNIAPRDWRRLLDVPAADLLRVQSMFPPTPPHRSKSKTGGITEPFYGGFGPVVDGIVLPVHPFDPTAPAISHDKPLITGWNEDEYTFFAWEQGDTSAFELNFDTLHLKLEPQYGGDVEQIVKTYRRAMPHASAPEIYVAISSITMMGLGSIEIGEKKSAQQGAPVYLYNFGYKSEMKIPGTEYAIGTPHAMDITFKFYNETPMNRPGFLSGNNPDRFTASRNMAALWTSFARTGKPSADGMPEWTPYEGGQRATMRVDTRCEIICNRFAEELDMWRSIGKL